MKKPISWHEANLKNRRRSLLSEKNLLEIQKQRVERLSDNVDLLSDQIDTAKLEGKVSFDSERFMKRRKK